MILCPHCEGSISEINFTPLSAKEAGKRSSVSYKAVAYSCPLCKKILTCDLDPLALKAEIVDGVTAELKRQLKRQ